MPWQGESEMDKRRAFLRRAIQPRANISELCREYGISRSVGHKILRRYREEGAAGIAPRSRRPNQHATELSGDIVCEIVALRMKYPNWGGKKLQVLLADKFDTVPCVRTVDRVLERAGMVRHKRRNRGRWLDKEGLNKPKRCNDIWTLDFKGWWYTKDRSPCFPLTIRDAYSRYILGIYALSGTGYEGVKEAFEELFGTYGLPEAILSDNGSPFASVLSVQGLTRLSAWWVKLLTAPRRIIPGCPYMNGPHERMHQDMKAELQRNPEWNLKDQQKRFDEWRETYNSIRPNEALGMMRPNKVYVPSVKALPEVIPEFHYPNSMQVRRTNARGYISWHQKPFFISGAIPLETIGIQQEEDESHSLWFCNLKLGDTTKNFEYPLGGTRASPYSFRHARNKRRDL